MKLARMAIWLSAFLSLATMAVSVPNDVHFEAASFTKEIWIKDKTVFKRPKGVDVEFVTSGAFDWVLGDATGTEVRTVRAKNEHGGWTSINFPSLGLFGDYSIGFRNASDKQQQIKQGDVHF